MTDVRLQVRPGFSAAALIACLAGAAFGQTPGEIADPGSYKGSMALQAQEQASAAQQQQQNQAMLNRLDQTYQAYAPGRGGSGPPLQQKPLLPPAQNPLLGLWRMGPTRSTNLGPNLGALPGAGSLGDAFAAGCSVFLADPNEVIRFTPTAVNKVGPDGREELVERVEYRSDRGAIIVLPLGTLMPVPLIVGLPNHDHAVVALFGCTMSRTAAAAAVAARAPSPAPGGGGKAVLRMTVGEMVDGRFSAPPAGTQLFLSTLNPDTNLVRAGFAPDPMESLFAACKIGQGGDQQRCNAGMQALKAGAIGVMSTDPNGHAATGELAPGRYYIVGFTPYRGHALVWHLPVDLRPGDNAMNLTPQAGSLSH